MPVEVALSVFWSVVALIGGLSGFAFVLGLSSSK